MRPNRVLNLEGGALGGGYYCNPLKSAWLLCSSLLRLLVAVCVGSPNQLLHSSPPPNAVVCLGP